MAAPFTITGDDFFRNIKSENASSAVWYQGSNYSLEFYSERYTYNLSWVGVFVKNQSENTLYPIIPGNTSVIGAGRRYVLFTSDNTVDPFIESPEYNQPNAKAAGAFSYLAGQAEISLAADLEVSDFKQGITTNAPPSESESIVPGELWGGTDSTIADGLGRVYNDGKGLWYSITVVVSANADLGYGWIKSYETTISTVSGTVPPHAYDILLKHLLRVEIQGAGGVGGGVPAPFPESRPIGYDPDAVWDPIEGEWTIPSALTTAGGGRFHRQLIVLGHKTIYVGDL